MVKILMAFILLGLSCYESTCYVVYHLRSNKVTPLGVLHDRTCFEFIHLYYNCKVYHNFHFTLADLEKEHSDGMLARSVQYHFTFIQHFFLNLWDS